MSQISRTSTANQESSRVPNIRKPAVTEPVIIQLRTPHLYEFRVAGYRVAKNQHLLELEARNYAPHTSANSKLTTVSLQRESLLGYFLSKTGEKKIEESAVNGGVTKFPNAAGSSRLSYCGEFPANRANLRSRSTPNSKVNLRRLSRIIPP